MVDHDIHSLFRTLLPIILLSIIVLNIIFAITIIFFEKRRAASSWAWILILFFLPVLGFILYLLVGRSIYHQKIFPFTPEEKRSFQQKMFKREEPYDFETMSDLAKKHLELIELNVETNQSFLCNNNDVEVFITGQDKFKHLFEDLRKATKTIYVQYYIFKRDEIGSEFCEILKQKAQEGVKVYLLYDDIGSRTINMRKLSDLRLAGVEVKAFFTSKFPLINLRVNNRNHRKIVVIDNKVAYTGGYNVGDEYLGKGPLGYWRDTHLRIEGDGALLLAYRFIDDWNAETPDGMEKGETQLLSFEAPQTQKQANKKVAMQLVSSGPDDQNEDIKCGYFKMITSAKEYIILQTPYFIPDDSLRDALKIAIHSGVEVHIMVPYKGDKKLTGWANMAHIQDMIKIGAKVSLYKKGFIHCKVLVIDDEVVSIGSANFDNRSFRLNFEMNAIMYDQELATKMREIYQNDTLDCVYADDKWRAKRTRWNRLTDGLSYLIAPIL